jgi:hypothetical protein
LVANKKKFPVRPGLKRGLSGPLFLVKLSNKKRA